MKILHIYDVAAVGKIISNELAKMDVESKVLSRAELDDFKFAEVYPEVTFNKKGRARSFFLSCIWQANHYDILHVHSWSWIVPKLRYLYPKKKIIIHFHGGEVRNCWDERKEEYKHADLIVVATPNLLEGKPHDFDIRWMPNPVDRKHWLRHNEYHPHTALHPHAYDIYDKTLDYVQKLCNGRGLQLTIIPRGGIKFPNKVYPRFMELFEYYVNIKQARYYDTENKRWTVTEGFDSDLSLNSLQALSLGMKVIHWKSAEGEHYVNKGEPIVLNEFPEEHDSKTVAKRWLEIYENI